MFQDHAKLLLTKEWLVKVDSESSTPYLLVCPSCSALKRSKLTERCTLPVEIPLLYS